MTRRRSGRRKNSQKHWARIDLHLHTPASVDFQEPSISYLDILRVAHQRELDIIGFTDHNSVAGYKAMQEDIERLELLEQLGRIRQDETQRLAEYRQLREKVLVLPGFEFTATFGFHILGLFAPETDIRELEFILLELNIPPDKLDAGSGEVGATSDVLTAYRVIDEAGGLVIAAHVDSSHGVAMRRMGFGGQTRIAYTQDPHLHALEVTDLESKGRRTTARFFDGSRPEYPRRMHCIQSSDSHRLVRDSRTPKNLGVGDRVTEVLAREVSFAALREVFLGNDFARTRAFRAANKAPVDFIRAAWEEGSSIVQDFHESYTKRGGRLYAILADVCAFANTNGGTIYVGLGPDPKEPPIGVNTPSRLVNTLQSEIERRVTPPLEVTVDVQDTQGIKVVRVVVPRGADAPYALDDSKIYVRSESETSMAVRDEIVNMVKRSLNGNGKGKVGRPARRGEPSEAEALPADTEGRAGRIKPPLTGVEIVETEERKGAFYHTVRDLRNGNVVKNVTRKSARRLWHYAISQAEEHPVTESQIEWHGDVGLVRKRDHSGRSRYDLAQREGGRLRIFFGVTEDGVHGNWAQLLGLETD